MTELCYDYGVTSIFFLDISLVYDVMINSVVFY